MKPKWILEKDMFGEELHFLRHALDDTQTPYKEVEYLAFEGFDYKKARYEDDDCVVAYCSLNLAKVLDKTAPWTPTIFCNLPAFECVNYYPHYGEYLLNRDYIMLPFGELKRQKEFLLKNLGQEGCVFIRPSNGFKSFTGMLFIDERWDKDIEYAGFYDIDAAQVVAVSSPKLIDAEWRLVILNGKVVTGSMYKKGGNKCEEAGFPVSVGLYAEVIASQWQPERIFVMDICESNGEFSLVEINSASCSGLYKCDKRKFVDAMNTAAIQEYEEMTNV